MTDVKVSSEQSDIDILAANPQRLYLPGLDIQIDVEKLRTRQLFKFLRILTVGAGPALADLQINSETNTEELTQQLLAILVISIPEAEDEVIEFLRSMVKPLGLIEPERSKADRDANVAKYQELFEHLDNPEPEDTLALLMHIVKAEAPNMIALGKQIAVLLPSAAKLTTSSKKPSKASTRTTS
jgi:hypothetical protein